MSNDTLMADGERPASAGSSEASSESSSSSSSSDSDFEEVDATPEDIKATEELRSALAKNPRQYEVHCQVSRA